MERTDDFNLRRAHLQNLTETELEERFWQLTEKIIAPLIKLAERHTTPSIERSVLLRMGFSSLEAKAIVKRTLDAGLLGKGAGHVVYRLSRRQGLSIRETGERLAAGDLWTEAAAIFGQGG